MKQKICQTKDTKWGTFPQVRPGKEQVIAKITSLLAVQIWYWFFRIVSFQQQFFYLSAIASTHIMNRSATTAIVQELMRDFAECTGLDPIDPHPRRYLWTDAFAVCNYLGLYQTTGNTVFYDLALRLADQVHNILGQHRPDDLRTGWISGLSFGEGELHPTLGGLRIGKPLPERDIHAAFNEQQEWDRDGQYYHYLTKWMHALNRLSRVTTHREYRSWAIELARTAHARFTYLPQAGGKKRMYWKMSIDLTRPLVSSMGLHDPVDGLVTYYELQLAAGGDTGEPNQIVLVEEISDMAGIGRGLQLATDDPLGTGGLLCDAARIIRIMSVGGPQNMELLENLLVSALAGLESFRRNGSLDLLARHRLAFRELGLSIGLAGVEKMPEWFGKNPHQSDRTGTLHDLVEDLADFVPLRENIEQFWLEKKNRESVTWTGHRAINSVMLATSLLPDSFLEI